MKVTKRVFDLNKFAEWVKYGEKTQEEMTVAHFSNSTMSGRPWAVDAVGIAYGEFVQQYKVVCDAWFTEVPLTPYFSLKKYIESMTYGGQSDTELYSWLMMEWVADCLDLPVAKCDGRYTISDNWVEYR